VAPQGGGGKAASGKRPPRRRQIADGPTTAKSISNIANSSDIADVKTIVLSPAAARAFDKLTPSAQRQINRTLDAYALHGIGDAKAMVGTPTVRLRSGDFRVIFDEDASRIVVLAFGDRREIYR